MLKPWDVDGWKRDVEGADEATSRGRVVTPTSVLSQGGCVDVLLLQSDLGATD